MALLETVKMLLGIESDDSTKDTILNHYINKANEIILGYCNVEELPERYHGALADFAVYLYKNRDMEGISKKREGERTVSIEDAIPQSIKLSLPLPKIKVGVTDVL